MEGGLDASFEAGLDEGEREIVVDVRVDAGECELDAVDAGAAAGLKESLPRPGRGGAAEIAGQGGEVEAGEDYVEGEEPCGGAPAAGRWVEVDLGGDGHVEGIEPFEAVRGGEEDVDCAHGLQDFIDAGGRGGADEFVELLIVQSYGHGRVPRKGQHTTLRRKRYGLARNMMGPDSL